MYSVLLSLVLTYKYSMPARLVLGWATVASRSRRVVDLGM